LCSSKRVAKARSSPCWARCTRLRSESSRLCSFSAEFTFFAVAEMTQVASVSLLLKIQFGSLASALPGAFSPRECGANGLAGYGRTFSSETSIQLETCRSVAILLLAFGLLIAALSLAALNTNPCPSAKDSPPFWCAASSAWTIRLRKTAGLFTIAHFS